MIENEFLAAMSSEKPTSVPASSVSQPPNVLPAAGHAPPPIVQSPISDELLAQIYAEQVRRTRDTSLVRHRRRRFASEAARNRDESAATSENDYEDVELGRAGGSGDGPDGWQAPSKPPRRKRSKSTSDFETSLEQGLEKIRRDVGTDIQSFRAVGGGPGVESHIESIPMCTLRVTGNDDVSNAGRVMMLTSLLCGV